LPSTNSRRTCSCQANHRTDSDAELEAIRVAALEAGADAAVASWHWGEGGKGAIKLAEAVVETCSSDKGSFRFLYDLDTSIEDKVNMISSEIYGADGIELSEEARKKVALYEAQVISASNDSNSWGFGHLPVCIAKTQYSFSTDANAKGAPTGFKIPVRDLRISRGAGFIVVLTGDLPTIPGLSTRPNYYNIDINPVTGYVEGLS
jgi:methylenetetrahydrofolate dehydrogenase (NADP+) / methenyltetrahydrofolate cyclohydrolase / formyltetrahydrofolate synthetase